MGPTLKNWKQKKHFDSIHHHLPKNLSIIYGIFEYCNLIFSSSRVTAITSFCLFTSIDNYSPPIHQKCPLFLVHFLYSISGSLSSKFYDVKTAGAGEKMHIGKTIQKMRKRWQKKKVVCCGILKFPTFWKQFILDILILEASVKIIKNA